MNVTEEVLAKARRGLPSSAAIAIGGLVALVVLFALGGPLGWNSPAKRVALNSASSTLAVVGNHLTDNGRQPQRGGVRLLPGLGLLRRA